MKTDSKQFRVAESEKLRLDDRPTRIKPLYDSKEEYLEKLAEHVRDMSEIQEKLYAHDRYSLLVIFQAMDGAGKDSSIKHVMSGVNPQGCRVTSFKHPSAEELDHDFLWRTTRWLPERGQIGIFNRSYYEEVLIVRVHPEILHSQALPDELVDEKTVWEQRFRSIVDFEGHLHRNGTRVVKIFLHVSKDEQRRRFLKRIDEADKNWKFNVDDMTERKYWKQYMKAYEDCMSSTSTKDSPWYVVPADDKKDAQLIVSRILLDTLGKLKLRYPSLSEEEREQLKSIRKMLDK
ncbi:MAG TPA: ADP-polyphosphate phosphotransferase [Terriglobia bacterium]|nr:ADP-polyphosphate phosphotransferase [Terriglobia bacterium]